MKTNYLFIILVGLSITAFVFICPRCEEPAAIPVEDAPVPVVPADTWEELLSASRFLLQSQAVDRYGLLEEVSQLTAEVSNLQDTVQQLQQAVESRLDKEDAED